MVPASPRSPDRDSLAAMTPMEVGSTMAGAGLDSTRTANGRSIARAPRGTTRWLTAVALVGAVLVAGVVLWPDRDRPARVLGTSAPTPGIPPHPVAQRWALPQAGTVLALAVTQDRVIVGEESATESGPTVLELRALDTATGHLAWVGHVPAGVAVAVVDDDEVVTTVLNPQAGPPSTVTVVSAADGARLWTRHTPGVEAMAHRGGRLLLAGASWCRLVGVADGRTRFEDATSACVDAGAAIVLRTDANHEVRTWSGHLLATHPRQLPSPVLGDGLVYLLDGDTLRGRALDGSRRWTTHLPHPSLGVRAIEGRGVAVRQPDDDHPLLVSPDGEILRQDVSVADLATPWRVLVDDRHLELGPATNGGPGQARALLVRDDDAVPLARHPATGVTLLRDPAWQLTTHGVLLPGPTGDWKSLSLHRYRDLAARWSVDFADEQLVRVASSRDAVVVLTRSLVAPRATLRGFR